MDGYGGGDIQLSRVVKGQPPPPYTVVNLALFGGHSGKNEISDLHLFCDFSDTSMASK